MTSGFGGHCHNPTPETLHDSNLPQDTHLRSPTVSTGTFFSFPSRPKEEPERFESLFHGDTRSFSGVTWEETTVELGSERQGSTPYP